MIQDVSTVQIITQLLNVIHAFLQFQLQSLAVFALQFQIVIYVQTINAHNVLMVIESIPMEHVLNA